MTSLILRLEDLTVGSGPFLIVDGLSLEIVAGELSGLPDPNGVGKSSMLRSLISQPQTRD